MLTAGCGTRVPADQFATGDGSSSGGGRVPGLSGGTGSGSGSGAGTGTGIGGNTTGTGAPGNVDPSVPTFGNAASPCGEGPADKSGYTASDKGVTPTEINIAAISDPGGPKPGLDQGVLDSMEAFGKWCNAQGGINGRKLVVHLRDAKILAYKEAVEASCAEDFAMVGGMGVLDNLGAQTQVDCGIINVPGVAVNPEQTLADLTYQSLPNLPTRYLTSPADWVKATHPDSVSKSAAIYTNLSVTKFQSERLQEGYTKRGFTFVDQQAANLSEENWGPIVSQMKGKGVTFMNLTSSFEELSPLAKEMKAQDFSPVVELETNFYNPKFPQSLQGQAEGFYVRALTWPIEEADQNPATQQYLDIMKEYKPDGVIEFLGIQSFSSALLWATAVKNLGADVTRDGLEAEIKKIHQWNGHGLHVPTDPGGIKQSACFIMMKVVGQGFERAYPKPDADKAVYENSVAKGYACPEEGFVEITGQDYEAMAAKKGKTAS